MKSMRIVFFLVFLLLYLKWIEPSFAQTMSNNSFIIKLGNLNTSAELESNSQYNIENSTGTTTGVYSGTNYTVTAGFSSKTATASANSSSSSSTVSTTPFSLSVSNSLIDFGVITPTNPVLRTVALSVSGATNGFTVTASENRPMTSQTNTIPDTSCDNGDCNTLKASLWRNPLAYGFGYRCDSLSSANSCSLDFGADFYKPFPSTPSAATIMTNQASNTSQVQITYKINVPATQTPGVYSNMIQFLANPGF